MWRVEAGASAATPWPDAVPLPSGAMAYDLVYNPQETAFMRRARAAVHCAVGGLGMLVYQGAERL